MTRKYKVFWSLPYGYARVVSPYAPQVCGAFTSKLKYAEVIGAGSYFAYTFVYEEVGQYPVMKRIALEHLNRVFVVREPRFLFDGQVPIFPYYVYDQETKKWIEYTYTGETLKSIKEARERSTP